MLPELKAEELFNKLFDEDACKEHQVCERVAKKHAIIIVDEIIKAIDIDFVDADNCDGSQSYWEEVKNYLVIK